MQDSGDGGQDYFHRIDPLRLDDAEDIELAFKLQNLPRRDPELLKLLIDHYAPPLYRWIDVLLYYQYKAEPGPAEILSVLRDVFTRAFGHMEQFHGQASVFTWLFGITYQVINRQAFSDRFRQFWKNYRRRARLAGQQRANGWENLAKLPEKQRTSLILRYLFNLGLPNIAAILNLQTRDIHFRLASGIKRLFSNAKWPDIDLRIFSYVDGFWEDDQDALSQFIEHLETCELCKSSLVVINGLEKSLRKSIGDRWEPVELDQELRDSLTRAVLLKLQQIDGRWKPKINLGQVAWFAGVSILFIGLAFVFIRLTPVERDFPQAEVNPTPQLPPVINMPPEMISSDSVSNLEAAPQFIDPAFSSDGKWAVFSYLQVEPYTQRLELPTINVYNREQNTFQVISENTATLGTSWPWWGTVWWGLAPSISGNGQRVVYTSSTRDPKITGSPCETQDQHDCLDIFLYDRETSMTKRITQSPRGGGSNGDSLAPTISDNGMWVAFWSAADNLAEGDNNLCQQTSVFNNCLSIYLYSAETGRIDRIPIQNIASDEVLGIDRISLSADGRYVGFTITSNSQPGDHSLPSPAPTSSPQNLGLAISANTAIPVTEKSSEAVVYDRLTGIYELENQAQDGTQGNGPSSSPVLSANGQYVAFVSSSSNLISGDNDQVSDVFVRDRLSGVIELVSVSSDGQQGNYNSGISFLDRGFYNINLSSNGRYVTFQSSADNLGQYATSECSQQESPSCSYLYVHDRQTGKTDKIVAVLNQVYPFFPGISADGRWIGFVQYSYNCDPKHYMCSNVKLYDRLRGWESDVTRFYQQSPGLPWSYSDSLALPLETWESQGFAISTDGKIIAMGGNDSKIRIWHITSGIKSFTGNTPEEILEASDIERFSVLAISQNDDWLAAGTTRGIVYVWELLGGRLIYTLKNYNEPIEKILFPQDGAHLIISTRHETWFWSINGSELLLINRISSGPDEVFGLDIAPRGNILATGAADGTVWLQNLPSGKVIGRLGGLSNAVYGLAFSADGTLLAARSVQGVINLWKISVNSVGDLSYSLLNSFQSTEYVGELAFSPDGKFLATTGTVGRVTLWSVPDAIQYNLNTQIPNGMVHGIIFPSAGYIMAAVFQNEIILWELPPKYESIFYTQAEEDTFLNSPPLPSPTLNDIPEFDETSLPSGLLSLDQATAVRHIPLIVPEHLPENLNFLGANVEVDGSAWLRYVTYQQNSYLSMLYIYEKEMGDTPTSTMTIGASAIILPIQFDDGIGQANAEFVQGDWYHINAWTSRGVVPGLDYQAGLLINYLWKWSNLSHSMRLRWQQQGILIVLYYRVNDSYFPALSSPDQSNQSGLQRLLLSREDLIQVASGMNWYDQASTGFTSSHP